MKKKFAVAAATAALITASFSMNVFADTNTCQATPEAATDDQKDNMSISYDPAGDKFVAASGYTVNEGFVKYNGKLYYVDDNAVFKEVTTGIYGDYYVKDGKRVTANAIVTVDGKSYLVDGVGDDGEDLDDNDSKVKKASSSDSAEVIPGFKVGKVTDDYLVTDSGEIVKGWKALGDNWYYAKPDGEVVEDKWVQTTAGRWYFIGKDGLMVSAENADAALAKDQASNVIATSTDDGKTATITQKGKTYVINADGLWLNGWVQDGINWKFYSDTTLGWAKYGTKWVFVETGYTAAQNKIVDTKYAVGADCYMVTGHAKINVGYVYANATGVLQSGFQKIDGVEYYFPTEDNAGATGTIKYVAKEGAKTTADGRSFFTDKTGKIIVNQWYKDAIGDWYYVDKDGKPVANGPATINGSKYYFDNNKMVTEGVYAVDVTDGTWAINAGKVVLPTNSLVDASETDKAAALVNTIVIDNTGRQINNGWANLGNGAWAYAKDGKAYDGWLLYNGSWYYIDNGLMVTNDYVGNYFLNANGVWTSTR